MSGQPIMIYHSERFNLKTLKTNQHPLTHLPLNITTFNNGLTFLT
jgi:hypothetical protein